MKKIYLLSTFILALMASSCTTEPEALEFPKEGFPPAHTFTFDTGSAFTTAFTRKENFFPNCITPDGDGTNDKLIIYLSEEDGYTWQDMVVYDDEKNIIAELEGSKTWDGKLNNGSVENGLYGFRIEVSYSIEGSFYAYGIISVRKCFEETDDIESAVFGDQLHPRVGEIYDTRQEITYCN